MARQLPLVLKPSVALMRNQLNSRYKFCRIGEQITSSGICQTVSILCRTRWTERQCV